MDVVLSVYLDVEDVTSDEAKCYLLFEVQLCRGTSQISIIGPEFVSRLDVIQQFWEGYSDRFESLRVCCTHVTSHAGWRLSLFIPPHHHHQQIHTHQ